MKKENKYSNLVIINILTSFNNTIISICNNIGNLIYISSCGKMGFKGTKKSTPYAAKIVMEDVIKKLINLGIKKVDIKIKGYGNGRESSLKALVESSILVLSIEDKTSIVFNGCRPPKKRRL